MEDVDFLKLLYVFVLNFFSSSKQTVISIVLENIDVVNGDLWLHDFESQCVFFQKDLQEN